MTWPRDEPSNKDNACGSTTKHRRDIANRHEYTADVIFELLAAYGRSKSVITQLREGHLNKAEDVGAVLQKDVVYFKAFAAGA